MYAGQGGHAGVTILIALELCRRRSDVSQQVLHVHVKSFTRYTVWDVPYDLDPGVDDDGLRTVHCGPELMNGMEGTVVENIGLRALVDGVGAGKPPRVDLTITARVAWWAPALILNPVCVPGAPRGRKPTCAPPRRRTGSYV